MGYVDADPKKPKYREVLFNFDMGGDEPVYQGFTDDSRWNGWLVIWVDYMQLERIIEDAGKMGLEEEQIAFRAQRPDAQGLYCLEGYTPVEVKKV